MKSLKILLLIPILCSCFEIELQKRLELEPFVYKFLSDYDYYGSEMDTEYLDAYYFTGEVEFMATAVREFENRALIVNKVWYDTASYSEREYVIYHELGHAILGREHEHMSKHSIMGPYFKGVDFYEQNRDSLLKELFGVE